MPSVRNRSAWMWVAIAAVAFTSVARAEAARQTARSYTHPVLQFLARTQSQNATAHSGAFRFANPSSRRQANSIARNAGSGAWIAMLPVFIGLVSPLTVSVVSLLSLRRPSAPPLVSALFQRPPPSLA